MCVVETSSAGREYKVRDMAQADFGCVFHTCFHSLARSFARATFAEPIGWTRARGRARPAACEIRLALRGWGDLVTTARGRDGDGETRTVR